MNNNVKAHLKEEGGSGGFISFCIIYFTATCMKSYISHVLATSFLRMYESVTERVCGHDMYKILRD